MSVVAVKKKKSRGNRKFSRPPPFLFLSDTLPLSTRSSWRKRCYKNKIRQTLLEGGKIRPHFFHAYSIRHFSTQMLKDQPCILETIPKWIGIISSWFTSIPQICTQQLKLEHWKFPSSLLHIQMISVKIYAHKKIISVQHNRAKTFHFRIAPRVNLNKWEVTSACAAWSSQLKIDNWTLRHFDQQGKSKWIDLSSLAFTDDIAQKKQT